jgi:hypothetical protein
MSAALNVLQPPASWVKERVKVCAFVTEQFAKSNWSDIFLARA